MSSAGKKDVRKPVIGKSPVIALRKAKTGDTESPSLSAMPGVAKKIGIKKNLLPVTKMNPAAVRVKGGVTGVANNSAEKRQPMVAVAEVIAKSSGRKPVSVPSNEDLDEEIMIDLHSQYLRTRLMAQIAREKSRLAKEKAVKSISELAVKHALDKEKLRCQVHSLGKIQTEAEHIVKIRNQTKIIEPLVKKMLTDDMNATNEDLCENLSVILDLLPVRNALTFADDMNANCLDEINKHITSSQENPESSLGCLQGLKQDEAKLQILVDQSETLDKEVNDKQMKMMSMKLSLLKLYGN